MDILDVINWGLNALILGMGAVIFTRYLRHNNQNRRRH